MSAKPQHKTCLSLLRSILGPISGGEKNFAKRIGRSRSWLKKASCNQIPLTEDAAVRISFETGVSRLWLEHGDTSIPPHDQNGRPFTKETFEATREAAEQWGVAPPDVENCFLDWLVLYQALGLKAIATSASANAKLPLLLETVSQFLIELEKKFGFAEAFEAEHLNLSAKMRLLALARLSADHKDPATFKRVQYIEGFLNPASEKHIWLRNVIEEKAFGETKKTKEKRGKPSRRIRKKK